MFICNRCGDPTEELPTIEERHPYGDTYAAEYFVKDNCVCGGEYEEATQCTVCGTHFLDEIGAELCDACYDDAVQFYGTAYLKETDQLSDFADWVKAINEERKRECIKPVSIAV